jgi:hypothetical protein
VAEAVRSGHCAICHSRGSGSRVVAKSAGSRETYFTDMDVQTVALSLVIFKRINGFETIGLGLTYRSMVLSQHPSRESVHLNDD